MSQGGNEESLMGECQEISPEGVQNENKNRKF